MNETKNCKNCKYFLQYYIKKRKKFVTAWGGRCINRHKRKDIERKPEDAACAYWEQAEPNDEKRQNTISELLQKVYEQLNELTQVLSAED